MNKIRISALSVTSLTGVVAPVSMAAPALAACPTSGPYMAAPTSSIVTRAAQDSQGYDNRGRSNPMTGTFSVNSSTTITYSATASYSVTAEMEASLWKVASAKIGLTFGAAFTAERSDTNDVGRSVNAYVPAGQYIMYYYGTDRVQVVGRILRDEANCTSTYLGQKTIKAPSNHRVFWTVRIA